jgi:hypothetical protein
MTYRAVALIAAVAVFASVAGAMRATPAPASCENDRCYAHTECISSISTKTGCDMISGSTLCTTYECGPN